MRVLLLLMAIFLSSFVQAQEQGEITIRFIGTYDQKRIETSVDAPTVLPGSTIALETLRFYISNVSFYLDDKEVFSEENSYHLVDAAISGRSEFTLKAPKALTFNQLRFNLGIDSVTNISGAMGGDLDPTNGMYWTWQSGYINFKLEGTAKNCPTRKNRFQFHLGGYSGTDNSLQHVKLHVQNQDSLTIALPLDKFLASINLSTQHTLMTPSPESVLLSKKIADLFEIVPQ